MAARGVTAAVGNQVAVAPGNSPARTRVTGGGDGQRPTFKVTDIQRSRLLSAAVATIEELGYTRTTVGHIIRRARVSRRTFYDLFENREACLLAVIEDALAQVTDELASADLKGLPWRERLRAGLWLILCFLDREPALARVLVVQALRGGQRVLERREDLLAALATVVDEGREGSARAAECPPLTAEGVVGAALAILHARLLKPQHEPLTGLLGELLGMIVLPYLGAGAARRERERPAPLPPARPGRQTSADASVRDVLSSIPLRLTYRTARVLVEVAEHPGASNRAVADHVGISDQGQVSRLLSRLERLGLLVNSGVGHSRGEPNAWRLTPTGQQVTHSIQSNARHPRQAA